MTRTKILVIALVVAALGVSAAAVALAQDSGTESEPASGQPNGDQVEQAGVPRGPEVDFCPTEEQTELHGQIYGFDYKPTVYCGADGPPQPTSPGTAPEDKMTQPERLQQDKEELESAKPLPDSDGDPTTIEGELPDGRHIIIGVSTENPEHFKGMTPKQFAEEVYP
jgi:hypothetical protein